MAAFREGGCSCGVVRYRLTEEPLTLYACHCTDCQRYSGSSFGLSMILAKSALEITRGKPASYAFTTPDGRKRHDLVCAACVTRLWAEPVKFPQVVILRPGTLDDTSWLVPVGHIWTRSAQPWVTIPTDTLNYEQQPDDMTALIAAWQD